MMNSIKRQPKVAKKLILYQFEINTLYETNPVTTQLYVGQSFTDTIDVVLYLRNDFFLYW